MIFSVAPSIAFVQEHPTITALTPASDRNTYLSVFGKHFSFIHIRDQISCVYTQWKRKTFTEYILC